MNYCVIPARGGSKRIPRKNIKLFCGKPMIVWSIEVAKSCGCFDRVIVSTDDSEIADIAKQNGAEVPFFRPSYLADDYSGTAEVVKHAVRWYDDQGETSDYVCCIYATAPFIQECDIRRGLKELKACDASFAVGVTSFDYPIHRAIAINEANRIYMLDPRNYEKRSQDFDEVWHDAGQFYWGRKSAWLANEPVLGRSSIPIKIPRFRVQDIDTQDDWHCAERLFRIRGV